MARREYRFEQYAAVRRYQGDLRFSPDGAQVGYIINTSGQFNLWVHPLNGGCPKQLTTFVNQTVRSFQWSPDGKQIALTADQNGDEFYQVYLMPASGGWPEPVTTTADAQHTLAGKTWSPDGRYLLFAGNNNIRSQVDVQVFDTKTGEPRTLVANGGLNYASAWSPDGKHISAVLVTSNTDVDIQLVEFASGEVTRLTSKQGEIVYAPIAWSADSTGFYLISDDGREFKGLAYWKLGEAGYEWVDRPEWDIEDADLSADGKKLAVVVNEHGYSSLRVRDLETGRERAIELPLGVVTSIVFSPDARMLACMLMSPTAPAEVALVDVDTGSVTLLTDGMLGGIEKGHLVTPTLIHFPTHDERDIPGYLYKPVDARKAPALLSIHGGPEAQERPTYAYAGLYQYLCSRGIGVLAPNVRGSTGYGKTYQCLIHRDWGGAELKDFEAAVEYLKSLDWVDPDRIGVFGGSFGGFATLSCVSRLPLLWAVAVDLVGPSNLITFVNSVPPHWRPLMDKWVGNPDNDREMLIERSPITYVDQIRCPLFVIQGANDPRVVKAESDQMVERLRVLGRDVRYDVYEDEGHGFTRRANELRALQDSAEFIVSRLLTPSK